MRQKLEVEKYSDQQLILKELSKYADSLSCPDLDEKFNSHVSLLDVTYDKYEAIARRLLA